MRKKFLLFVVLLIIIPICLVYGKDNASLIPNTIRPLTPKFDYETGVCLCDHIPVEYGILSRGTEISISDEDEDYYYFVLNSIQLAVSKDLVRLTDDAAPSPYLGYTKSKTAFYGDLNCSTVLSTFAVNTEVHVLDSFHQLLLVEYNGELGYVRPQMVGSAKWTVSQKNDNKSIDYDSFGSSSSGHSSVPSGPSSSHGDGEDITLSARNVKSSIRLLQADSLKTGTLLGMETPVFLTVLNRGDPVHVLLFGDDESILVIQGHRATLPSSFIRLNSEAAYECWTAYVRGATTVYSDYSCTRPLASFAINESLMVIDAIGENYVVLLTDGSEGYVRQSLCSQEKWTVPTTKPVSSVDVSDTHTSSGGSHSQSQQEWTAPVK